MKHTKRILALLLTLVLLCTGVPFVFAENPDEDIGYHYLGTRYIYEGQTIAAGENLSYTLENNVLTISGGGNADYIIALGILNPENGDTYSGAAFPLDKVVIAADVNETANVVFWTGFFDVAEENQVYSSDEYGALYNKDKTVLIMYPLASQAKTYIVPDSVKEIEKTAIGEAFYLDELIFSGDVLNNHFNYPVFLLSVTYAAEMTEAKNGFGLGESGIVPQDYIFKGMNTNITSVDGPWPFGGYFIRPKDISMAELKAYLFAYLEETDEVAAGRLQEEFLSHIEISYTENVEYFYVGTIHCHAGSTAEAYAIEHGMDYELTHFFEGDWTYDWDNLIRWRKCIHCDERETEPLETEQSGDTEIVGPADDDTSFDVEPVTETSTEYVLIQEVLGEMNIVKAFDISLKNNDGVHVQPKGTVKVKLPYDFQSESYKVYRVNDDGTYTDMNAYREGSHLVFFTDHFSLYVIVDESEAAPDEPSTPDEPATPDAPEEGDKSFFGQLKSIIKSIVELIQKMVQFFKSLGK